MRSPLVRRILARYAGRMRIHHQPSTPMRPLPHLRELDKYEGRWVALRHGHVLVDASTSTELALKLRTLPDKGHGAVMQYVQPEADSYIVGVG